MANIELRVRGQRLLVNRGYVVAGTVRYLTIKAALSEDWRGREVWAYLEFGDKKYKTQLNANGESTARAGLNLSAGEWSIYLMGYGKDADGNETCITSDRVTINVHPTGASGGEQLPADEEGAPSGTCRTRVLWRCLPSMYGLHRTDYLSGCVHRSLWQTLNYVKSTTA